MVSNIGNSFNKKQIFLVLGLFFSFSSLGAMCPQTVGAVVPGEAIWRVTSRIGQAANVIQSQICALEFMMSSTMNINCSFEFGQDDVGVGGIYTISEPGIYCMRENISFSTGAAITISSDDVTIEMNGHTLDGGGNTTQGILLGSGVNNVIIQNGIIENIGGTTPSGAGITDGAGLTLSNITIRDMLFNNNSVAAINLINGLSFDVDGLLVENCQTYNSGNISAFIISGIVRNCVMQENRTGSVSLLALGGITPVVLGSDVLIQDCVMTVSTDASSGISVVHSEKAIVRNCSVSGVSFATGPIGAIESVDCQDLVIADCIVQGNQTSPATVAPSFGIGIINSGVMSNVAIERCAVSGSENGFRLYESFSATTTGSFTSIKINDCVAEKNITNGFFLEHISSELDSFSGVSFNNCCAQFNGLNGFLMQVNPEAAPMQGLSFENCIAQGNNGDGFSFLSLFEGEQPNFADALFINCIAQGNLGGTDSVTGITFLGDGFAFGSSPSSLPSLNIGGVCQNCFVQNNANDGIILGEYWMDGKVIDCCAMNNGNFGIRRIGSNNVILGNAAFNNTAGDISGVSDPSLIISRTLLGGLAGATRWVNAVS